MKRSKITLFSIAALMIAMLACSAVSNLMATPTPLPTSTPRATSTPAATATPQGVLFEENTFDSSSCFPTFATDQINRRAENGQYFIDILTPGYIGWTYCEDQSFTDFVLEADISQINGPTNSEYGVVFRYDDTLKEFYSFSISSDGYYAFSLDGADYSEANYLIEWKESDAIIQGLATNHVKVVANRTKFQFYVNNQLVDEFEDFTHSSGWVGFVAFAPKDGSAASFSYDNLVVRSASAGGNSFSNPRLSTDDSGDTVVTSYAPTDTFYIVADVDNGIAGTVLEAKWYTVDVPGYTAGPIQTDSPSLVTIDEDGFTGIVHFSLFGTASDPWPTGTYKVELYANDALLYTLDFSVQ